MNMLFTRIAIACVSLSLRPCVVQPTWSTADVPPSQWLHYDRPTPRDYDVTIAGARSRWLQILCGGDDDDVCGGRLVARLCTYLLVYCNFLMLKWRSCAGGNGTTRARGWRWKSNKILTRKNDLRRKCRRKNGRNWRDGRRHPHVCYCRRHLLGRSDFLFLLFGFARALSSMVDRLLPLTKKKKSKKTEEGKRKRGKRACSNVLQASPLATPPLAEDEREQNNNKNKNKETITNRWGRSAFLLQAANSGRASTSVHMSASTSWLVQSSHFSDPVFHIQICANLSLVRRTPVLYSRVLPSPSSTHCDPA